MMTKFMNKQRGLLAAIMALVMVFAGVAVMATEADAAVTGLEIDDAKATFDGIGEFTNDSLGNNITVTPSEEEDNTYLVEGFLAYQDNTSDFKTKLFPVTDGNYGIIVSIVGWTDEQVTATIDNIDDEKDANKYKNSANWVFQIEEGDTELTITVGESTTPYKIDISKLVLGIPVDAENFVESVNTGGYYYLTEDIEFDDSLIVGAGVTIDLNGHTLEVVANATEEINYGVEFSGDTVLKNGTFNVTFNGSAYADREDVLTESNGAWIFNNFAVYRDGKLTFDNVDATIFNNSDDKSIVTGLSNEAMGNCFGLVVDNLEIINGSNVTVSGANRGIYAGNITITDSTVNAYGFERGIVRMNLATATTEKITVESSTVNAYLLEGGKTNGFTADDRCGIKAEALDVKDDSTVNTYGIHIEEAGSSVEGTLNVYNYVPTSKDDKFSGFVIDDENSIDVSGEGSIVLGTGIITNAKFTNQSDDTTVVLANVVSDSDVAITAGSIVINGAVGSYSEDEETGSITVTGNVEISGTLDVAVTVSNGTITIPADEELIIADAGNIVLGDSTKLTVLGTVSGTEGSISAADGATGVKIDAVDPSAVKDVVSDGLKESVDEPAPKEATTIEGIEAGFEASNVVKLMISLNMDAGDELTIPAGKTLDLNGFNIILTGSTVTGADGGLTIKGFVTGTGMIIVNDGANLYLDEADVRVPVIAGENAFISIVKPKEMTVKGDSTADLGVGYGNTLVLSDLTVPAGKSIDAYGNVVIEGTVTIQKGAAFNVYAGGNAQIDGALVIEGTANVKGDMDVAGSVKVYNADGNAVFNVSGTSYTIDTAPETFKPTVDVLGTMDVLKGKSKDAKDNILNVTAGDLNVEGTLTVTGKLTGNVNDMGTIVFNGKSVNGQITVFDGVTLTIASATGDVTITDAGIVDTEEYTVAKKYYVSVGNTVTLNNVKNVIIAVVLDESTVKVGSDSKRLIASEMTVTGTIAAVDDSDTSELTASVGIKGADASAAYDTGKTVLGSVVIGDVTLGKKVGMSTTTGDITVTGTVNAVAEDSTIATETDAVDVEGTIIVAGDDVNLKVNGAMYVIDDITDDKDPITYYTTFENAIAAVATAYDNEVTILGEVEVATALEIPAEATVLVEGALTIDVDGKITVVADAVFDATGATTNVDIDGMLVIMDKEYGLEGENKLTYQVYTETETTATYSGLVLALQNAVDGDVITLKQNADITKSVTIPEGVTLVVPNNVDLFIGDDEDKVTLTVAGKLEVQNGGEVKKATDAAETTIAIPGVVTMSADNAITVDKMTDYVEFTMKVDGKDVHVHSNLAYAAENAVNRDVTIRGDVSGGDITFTYDGKIQALAIKVPVNSTLTVGTLTLVGDGASIQADKATGTDENGTITGTIATAAGSVDLVKVSNVTLATSVDVDVDGSTDVVTVTGAPVGSFTVASGTVTAATGFAMNATKDNKMSVASGATLIAGESFVAAGDADAYVIIDGIVSIVSKTTAATITAASVSGSIAVDSGATVDIGGNSVITGTITVAEKTDDANAGKANVKGNLFVGTAPAIGSTGSIIGAIETDEGYLIAYPGSDLTGALIDVGTDGESEAESTEFYINGELYMTVYTAMASPAKVGAFVDGLEIEIPGLVTPNFDDVDSTKITGKWYTDESMKTDVKDATVGSVEKVYTVFDAAEVDLVVSAGVGLKVYIDGLAVENFKVGDEYLITVGTHTVSFAVESGYDGANATITVNGVQVSNNGTFTVDADSEKITIIASGAVPAQSGSTVIVDDADDGMALTDILLIVLVVLIVIMAIIVALRMMRS